MPPVSSDLLASILLPFGYVVGAVRIVLVVALGVLYMTLVGGVCVILVSDLASYTARTLTAAFKVTNTAVIPYIDAFVYCDHCATRTLGGWRMVDTGGGRNA